MKLAVINTGGTISCKGTPLAPMSAQEFADNCGRLLDPTVLERFPKVELHYITDMVFPDSGLTTLDSTNLQPLDWCVMAQRILEDYEDFDGWIILHGTDSMAYTAGALPFLLSSYDKHGFGTGVLSKPVILTGSQIPLFSDEGNLRFDTDGYQNFCSAIAFARRGVPEVALAFRGKLLRGNRSVKTNANMDDAFSSPNLEPLGLLGTDTRLSNALILKGPPSEDVSLDSPAVRERMLQRVEHIRSTISDTTVMPFQAFPAAYGQGDAKLAQLLQAIVATGVDGIILESYGEGNLPSGGVGTGPFPTAVVLKKAVDGGLLVVNCTQVIRGNVDDSAYAAGAWLPAAGALAPGDMTPIAAFAKATVLLAERGWTGNDWEPDTVANLMRQSLAGEMRISDRLGVDLHPELLEGESLRALDSSARLWNDPAAGMRLLAATGEVLWRPGVEDSGDSCVLRLSRSALCLRNRSGQKVWSHVLPTGITAGALVLRGSHANDTLSLVLVGPSGDVVHTLYADANSGAHA